eukprot:gi/632948271/ref/XP_007889499.1/ PREDICTED: leucine-rich repeat and WD repeat-containing protein KIAA1239-like [Callorhinchus milii]
MILRSSQNEGLSTGVLEEWYRRDENALPPIYYLQGKAEVLPHYYDERDRASRELARAVWLSNYREMKAIFSTTVRMCVEDGTMGSEQARKYFTTALEEELLYALVNRQPSIVQNSICYIFKTPQITHHLEQIAKGLARGAGIEEWSGSEAQTFANHRRLRDELLPSLVSSGLHLYTSMLPSPRHGDCKEQMEQEYMEGLCSQFYSDAVRLIDRSNVQRSAEVHSATDEAMEYLPVCDPHPSLWEYQWEEVEQVKDYIVGKQSAAPLLIIGRPCTGKTLLLTACAKQVLHLTLLFFRSPLPLPHHVRTAPEMSGYHCGVDLKDGWAKEMVVRDSFCAEKSRFWVVPCFSEIMTGMCQQIAQSYKKPTPLPFRDAEGMKDCFASLLAASTEQRPLIIIIDAIDQISEAVSDRTLWWFPKLLPPFVRLIISAAPKKFGLVERFRTFYPNAMTYVELKPRQRKECNKILTQSLHSSNRRISSGQQVYVNAALVQCTLPLFVTLLHNELLCWRSHVDVNGQTLGTGVHDSIERLLQRLEEKHGEILVSRALGYVTLANSGLSEAELLDILSLDNSVLQYFWPQNGTPASAKVPYYALARLWLDLHGFLAGRMCGGVKLLRWTSRHFSLVIRRRYLRDEGMVQEMHGTVAEYFGGRWANGRGKPMLEMQESREPATDLPKCCPPSPGSKVSGKVYIDRQQPSQPWLFTARFPNSSLIFPNHRKAMELPFHLKKSRRLEDLYSEVMSSFEAHWAMTKAGLLAALITELDDNTWTVNRREMRFLSSILKKANCLLRWSPDELPSLIQTMVLPFVECFPQLDSFLKQAYTGGLEHSAIAVLRSPVATVPRVQAALCSSAAATDIIETQLHSLVLAALEDGSVFAWDLEAQGLWEQLNTKGVKVTRVGLSEDDQFLALATARGTVLVYDFALTSLLYEVEVRRSVDGSEPLPPRLDFALCGAVGLVWSEKCTRVRVLDLASGCWAGEDLRCHHEVECLSFSDDRRYALCGQRTGAVTVFDLRDGFPVATVCPPERPGIPVHSAFLPSSGEEMCVVDRIGNVWVWALGAGREEPPPPPRLLEEHLRAEGDDELLSVELSRRCLLLCRASRVELWDTLSWDPPAQFKAPRNGRFARALLSRNADAIVAAVEASQSLFVWRRESGRCVLMLENRPGAVLALTKCRARKALVSLTSRGYLTAWDLDCVDQAAATAATERPVQALLLSPGGEHFYAADGTSVVYKWSLTPCRVRGTFRHAERVQHCSLAAAGELLVSADEAGDLYVWDTGRGLNLQRIRGGGRVTQLTVAPNGRSAVSLGPARAARVWKLPEGHVVCEVRARLRRAVISPASTFLLGLERPRLLLAVSLWSGGAAKSLASPDASEIVAFRALPEHPDYVLLVTAAGSLYTWNMAEDSLCRQLRLPVNVSRQLDDFQVCAAGRTAVLSVVGQDIHVLNLLSGRLCVIGTRGAISHQRLTRDGRYVIYVCDGDPCGLCRRLHASAVLNAVRLTDGKRVGSCRLCKAPRCLALSEEPDLDVFVGFEDGSVGVYAVVDQHDAKSGINGRVMGQVANQDGAPPGTEGHFLCKAAPNAVWSDIPHHEH